MPRFRYTAINTENKRLSGSIEGANEQEARGKLNNFGLSIMEMKEVTAEEAAALAEQKKITFSATDAMGKKVMGTIAADTDLEAYKKLKEEYELNIIQIGENTDMQSLENLYQTELAEGGGAGAASATKKAAAGEIIEDDSEERARVDDQINRTIALAQSTINDHLHDIIPEVKKTIELKLDQLQRVRRSSNLSHVRTMCKDLLAYLKKETLFVKQEEKVEERTNIQIASDNLIEELSSTGLKKNMNVLGSIKKWAAKRKEQKPAGNEGPPSFVDKIINIMVNRSVTTNMDPLEKEIKTRKQRLKEINGQIREYIGVWITAQNSAFRTNATAQIKAFWAERTKVKQGIQEIKMKQEAEYGATHENKILDTLNMFSGWVLSFYLIFYFIAIQIITKDFGFAEIPHIFYVYNSTFLKYFFIAFFIIHAATSLKLTFFRKNKLANFILLPASLASICLIIINL